MTAKEKEETLSLEEFPDEITGNTTMDDDIILASQGDYSRESCIKIEPNRSLYNFSELKPKSNQWCTPKQNWSNEDHEMSVELPNYGTSKFSHHKDTQEDIFICEPYLNVDQKVPKAFHGDDSLAMPPHDYNFKKEIEKSESESTTVLVNDFETELVTGTLVKNHSIPTTFTIPHSPQTLLCSFDMKPSRKADVKTVKSPLLFTEDCTNIEDVFNSCPSENFTSDIILSTQPKASNSGSECRDNNSDQSLPFSVKQEVIQNLTCWDADFEKTEPIENFTTKTFNFKLSVSCMVVSNAITSQTVDKVILNVEELSESELVTKGTREGSSLSRNRGFSRRPSTTEEGMQPGADRVQWSNEILLPLKLDELVRASSDPPYSGTPRISRQSSSTCVSNPRKSENGFGDYPDDRREDQVLFPWCRVPDSIDGSGSSSSSDNPTIIVSSSSQSLLENGVSHRTCIREGCEAMNRTIDLFTPEETIQISPDIESDKSVNKSRTTSESFLRVFTNCKSKVRLSPGQNVLTRLTAQRYFPGTLVENLLENNWRVEFDDGVSQVVAGGDIIPWEWLRAGDLVLTLMGGEYLPGKIIGVNGGDTITYNVELDQMRQRVTVGRERVSMTEVMANIVKERFTLLRPRKSSSPLNITSSGEAKSVVLLKDKMDSDGENIQRKAHGSEVGVEMVDRLKTSVQSDLAGRTKVRGQTRQRSVNRREFRPVLVQRNSRGHPKRHRLRRKKGSRRHYKKLSEKHWKTLQPP